MIKECIEMSAMEISQLIFKRQISVYDVVHSHIEHSQSINLKINAIVNQCYEEALTKAKKFDCVKSVRKDKPLFGVPFSVKESIAIKGLPNTYGSYYRCNDVANKTATVVTRLLNAGAILIGQTNLSELALWPECTNIIYGKTSNPYNTLYTSGGSSGGDAAVVGAGGVPFSIGTDGGGSIRIPAACCGVFGHKASSKYIPMSGHFPLDQYYSQYPAAQFIARFFSVGPICRKAEDLLPLLKILSGPDGIDKNIDRDFSNYSQINSVKGLKIYVLENKLHSYIHSTSPEIINSIKLVSILLEKEGAEIIPLNIPFLSEACELWFDIILTSRNISLSSLINDDGSIFNEIFHMLVGKKRIMLSSLILLVMDRLFSSNSKTYIDFLYLKNKISMHINKYLDSKSVMLLPTHPKLGIKHNRTYMFPFDFLNSAVFNLLELPATNVPIFHSINNTPICVQLVGSYGCDHVPISLAYYLEKLLGGWKSAGI